MVWFCYYDLWSKVHVFGDMFSANFVPDDGAGRKGPKNMLTDLPNPFSMQQLEDLRVSIGKSKEGTKDQLRVWKNRKFITYSAQTGLYTKTQEF